MICKKCGYDNDPNSKYCSKCGKPLYKKPITFLRIILVLLCFLLVPILILKFAVEYDKNGGGVASSAVSTVTERNVTSSDFSYQTSQGMTSYTITIVPNRKIKSLSVSLILYDDNNNQIFADTISKTDLLSGSSYSYTFDFGFLNSLSGSSVRFSFNGKVSTI